MKIMKSRAQKIWIRTLLILIGILLLVVTALTNWMIQSFTNEIIQLNYHLTSLVQESTDTRLKEIDNISSQIELSAANLTLSKMKRKDQINTTLTYPFSNQVRNYKLANRYIEQIYIYYPAIDYVIGDLGSFSSKSYYLLHNKLAHQGYNEWINKITNQPKNYYFDGESLMFSRQLPYNDFAETTASIVIKINRDEIMNTLESTRGAGTNAVTAVIGSDLSLYAAAGKDSGEVLEALPAAALSGSSLSSHNNYYILKRDSTIGGLKYITVVNRTELLSLANKIRNIAYLVLFGCLLAGVYISFYISKKNNQPLISIVNKVRENGGGTPDIPSNTIDEYSLIANRLEHFSRENVKSSLRLEVQQSKIESLFLSNVLSSEQQSSPEIFAAMQRLDVEFLSPQFAVMLIRPQKTHSPDGMAEKFHEWIPRLHEINKTFYFIAAEYRGDLVLLFNVEGEVAMKELTNIAVEFLPLLKDVPGTIITLGSIYDSLSDIAKSYHQARETADLQQNAQSGVFVYDAASMGSAFEYSDTSAVMNDFNRYMDMKNYQEAHKMVDILFNQLAMMDDYVSQCKKYVLLHRVITEVQAIGLQNKTLDVNECIQSLSNSKSIGQLRKAVVDIINLLQEKQPQSSVKQNTTIAKSAREIIEAGYSDPMMGLYSISEQLGVTNTYLSKVFKETYGQGLVQFINQQRIEKAIQLITTTSLSVKEVAFQVGYASDVSFIRVFKQYTNTTPGKFKGKHAN